MNELLSEKLRQLSSDSLSVEAVRKVFEINIENHKPNPTDETPNEIIGEQYRAYDKAKKILSDTIKDIISYEYQKNKEKTYNKGK